MFLSFRLSQEGALQKDHYPVFLLSVFLSIIEYVSSLGFFILQVQSSAKAAVVWQILKLPTSSIDLQVSSSRAWNISGS